MQIIKMESCSGEFPENTFVRGGHLRVNLNDQSSGIQGILAFCGWKESQSDGTLKVRRELAHFEGRAAGEWLGLGTI